MVGIGVGGRGDGWPGGVQVAWWRSRWTKDAKTIMSVESERAEKTVVHNSIQNKLRVQCTTRNVDCVVSVVNQMMMRRENVFAGIEWHDCLSVSHSLF